jgi:hypothetical protein
VYAAIDSVDSYKRAAVEGMRQTVEVLTSEVDRAQRYLERVHDRGGPPEPALSLGPDDLRQLQDRGRIQT